MIRILVLITLCLAPFALAITYTTCTTADVTASGCRCHVSCTCNDQVLQLLQTRYAVCLCPLVHLCCGLLPHHLVDHLWL